MQVTVTGQCDKGLVLRQPELRMGGGVEAKGLNPDGEQVAGRGDTVSYMWEMVADAGGEKETVKAEFSVRYKMEEENEEEITYRHCFDVSNHEVIITFPFPVPMCSYTPH